MNKRVVVVSSSPRRMGNSELLCDAFIRGARESGNTVEKLQLNEMDLKYCNGCGACFDRKLPCPQNDDIAQIEKKMVAADVVVFVTPLYFYMMSGQMKTFLDRACSYYEKMQDTEFYYIVTCADENPQAVEQVVNGFRGFTRCIDGAVEKGIIYGIGVWHEAQVKGKEVMEQSYRMGKGV